MSKREELIEILYKSAPQTTFDIGWERESLIDAMVAAYNRAIDDAKKIENVGVLGQIEMERLKIV